MDLYRKTSMFPMGAHKEVRMPIKEDRLESFLYGTQVSLSAGESILVFKNLFLWKNSRTGSIGTGVKRRRPFSSNS